MLKIWLKDNYESNNEYDRAMWSEISRKLGSMGDQLESFDCTLDESVTYELTDEAGTPYNAPALMWEYPITISERLEHFLNSNPYVLDWNTDKEDWMAESDARETSTELMDAIWDVAGGDYTRASIIRCRLLGR